MSRFVVCLEGMSVLAFWPVYKSLFHLGDLFCDLLGDWIADSFKSSVWTVLLSKGMLCGLSSRRWMMSRMALSPLSFCEVLCILYLF